MNTKKAITLLESQYLNSKLSNWTEVDDWVIVDQDDMEQIQDDFVYLDTLEKEQIELGEL